MTFATAEEVETIRGIWGTMLARDHEAARDWAIQRLREDLVKPDEGESPDAYLYRANAVPLGLMGARQFAIAESIYESLIKQVDAFNRSNKVRKHRGALLANQAVCRIVLGRFDTGVPQLIFTVKDEDWKTFGEPAPKSVTPAMGHLRNLFELPALRLLSLWSEGLWFRATRSKPGSDDFEEAVRPLETARWSLFATVRRTHEVWLAQRDYPSDYAGPRLLDGIRGMTAILEHLAKTIGRNSNDPTVRTSFRAKRLTLFPCLKRLFDGIGPTWWTDVKKAVEAGTSSFDAGNSAEDFRTEMNAILAWGVTDMDSLTARCLTLALLSRNYSVHELDPPEWFLATDVKGVPFIQVLSHSACALLALSKAAAICGHIGRASND